ncbi:hypothetical protein Tco_0306287, partial [Tanacetum coccineum]
RKPRKDSGPTEPITDKATNKEHIPTPSYDPSQSGEDRMQLNELIDLCADKSKITRKQSKSSKPGHEN